MLTTARFGSIDRRVYRVVPAAQLLRHFASDRSHMRAADGRWQSPPPPHPCIVAADGDTHTLPHYLDMPPLEQALDDASEVAFDGDGDGASATAAGGGAAPPQYGVCLTERALIELFSAF